MIPTRLLSVALVSLVALGTMAGCARRNFDDVDELRAAIRKTEGLSYRYVYKETVDGEDIEVRGVIEDDLRYKARLIVNGDTGMDEVVFDDALATRFANESALERYLRPGDPPKRRGEKLESEVPVGEALRARHWVLDPAGAPSLLPGATRRVIGEDPIYDSLTIWQFLDQATRSHFVVEFNKDSLDYREDEDPFPWPEKLYPGRDVKRYDYLRNSMPRASDQAGANQAVPTADAFRKMSVYVEDGVVIRVEEFIDVADRLDDLRRNYEVDLPDDEDEAIRVAMAAINAVHKGQGNDPIRVRRMSLELFDIGEPNKVELPADAIVGDLGILRNRGFVLEAA